MFKAWDIKERKLVDVDSITFRDDKPFSIVAKHCRIGHEILCVYFLDAGEFYLMVDTGYRDLEGNNIYTGHIVEFYEDYDCIWRGLIVFEDGVFTVDISKVKQVKNPNNWDQKHDWIRSRHWSTTVGYGEYGTWNCPRQPLSRFGSVLFNDYETEFKPLYEKYGWSGGRILNVSIVDFIYRSPKLLEDFIK